MFSFQNWHPSHTFLTSRLAVHLHVFDFGAKFGDLSSDLNFGAKLNQTDDAKQLQGGGVCFVNFGDTYKSKKYLEANFGMLQLKNKQLCNPK